MPNACPNGPVPSLGGAVCAGPDDGEGDHDTALSRRYRVEERVRAEPVGGGSTWLAEQTAAREGGVAYPLGLAVYLRRWWPSGSCWLLVSD